MFSNFAVRFWVLSGLLVLGFLPFEARADDVLGNLDNVRIVQSEGAGQVSSVAPMGAPSSFADLVEVLAPSVVTISTIIEVDASDEIQQQMPNLPPNSPFFDFFNDYMQRNPNMVPHETTAQGSGFVVDADEGLIITNNHVVEDAKDITVLFSTGESVKAELVGLDSKVDIAVLRIDADFPLNEAHFGHSGDMRVGDWVVAIGNPFGLGGTVTAGIISATARDIGAGPYDDFLQTDAAINRGNSGGPMFNLDGEVIGINTAIYSPSGASAGIGFAVPSDLAVPVINQILEFGRTKRGWMGVRIQSVNEEFAASLGLEEARGALIGDVTAGGPAESAGFQAGDVILSFDGVDIGEMHELPRIVAEHAVGSEVDVKVWRQGGEMILPMVLGELELAEETLLAADDGGDEVQKPVEASDIEEVFGLSLVTITQSVKSRYGLDDDIGGVLIVEVEEGSDAAEKGLLAGDVILEVNQDEVSNADDVLDIINMAHDQDRPSVLLMVNRGGDRRFFALSVEEK